MITMEVAMASVLQWPVFSGAHTGGIKFLLQSRLSYADAGCQQNVCVLGSCVGPGVDA